MSTVTEKPMIEKPVSQLAHTEMDAVTRESKALAMSMWTPAHLKSDNINETIATCTALVRMSQKWNMAAGMVAGETYSVKGKVGFQGKLYAALANAHGNLKGGLRVLYGGSGNDLAAVVFGIDQDCDFNAACREWLKRLVKAVDSDAATELELAGVKAIRVTVAACKTDNKMWAADPQQKLFYTGSTKWCRRFMPDLILGAISVEDIEFKEYSDRVTVTADHGNRTDKLESKLSGLLTHEEDPYAEAAASREKRLAEEAARFEEASAKAEGVA